MELSDLQLTISRDSNTPIWLQIKSNLILCIEQGAWKPGQIIANENTLLDIFNVSIGTVRKAVGELENEGILIRKQGIGTFVANHDKTSFLYKYFHILPDNSEKVFPQVELLDFKIRKIRKKEAEILLQNKAETTKVFNIRNAIRINKKLCMVDDIVISCKKFPLLSEEIFANRGSTIYNLYQDRFGIFVVNISESLKAISAPNDIKQILKIETGAPILKISRVSYTFNNSPIELRTSYVNTKNVKYQACSDQKTKQAWQ